MVCSIVIIGLLGLAAGSWINTMEQKKTKTRLGLMSNIQCQ